VDLVLSFEFSESPRKKRSMNSVEVVRNELMKVGRRKSPGVSCTLFLLNGDVVRWGWTRGVLPRRHNYSDVQENGTGRQGDPSCMTMTAHSHLVTGSIWDEFNVSAALEFCVCHGLHLART
jgi:hypothetical protein